MIDPTTISRAGRAIYRDRLRTAEASRRARRQETDADYRAAMWALAERNPAILESRPLFSPAESARLRFVRWLFQTDRIEP